MKVLIVSDSHGRDSNLKHVIKKVEPIDLLIHLGDYNGDLDYIKEIVNCQVEAVCGNNDFFSNEENEKIINIGIYKVFLTHGHRYGVSYNLDRIKNIGQQHGVDIVMFGHTHRPHIDLTGDLWTINPGSISFPRQSDGIPTYIIMEIDKLGYAHFTLNHVRKTFNWTSL